MGLGVGLFTLAVNHCGTHMWCPCRLVKHCRLSNCRPRKWATETAHHQTGRTTSKQTFHSHGNPGIAFRFRHPQYCRAPSVVFLDDLQEENRHADRMKGSLTLTRPSRPPVWFRPLAVANTCPADWLMQGDKNEEGKNEPMAEKDFSISCIHRHTEAAWLSRLHGDKDRQELFSAICCPTIGRRGICRTMSPLCRYHSV